MTPSPVNATPDYVKVGELLRGGTALEPRSGGSGTGRCLWIARAERRGSPFWPVPVSSTMVLPRACGRSRSAGRSRSPPRYVRRASFRRIMNCPSASSATREPAMPPRPFSDGDLDCLIVLGSGFNERDTMHWTVGERTKASMIHVNTDMDELTAHGDAGHVVPGSCHAFLDLMQERADDYRAGAAGRASAPARVADEDQGRAAALRRGEHQPADHANSSRDRDRGIAQGISARRHRAGRFRRAPRLRRALLEQLTSRGPTSRPPISGRWAGPYRPPSACSARGRSVASR